MRSQKSINRKAVKARARRKDFIRRKNINKNVPTITKIDKVEKYVPIFKTVSNTSWNGKTTTMNVPQYHPGTNTPRLAHVGYKEKKRKVKVFKYHYKGNPHDPLIDDSLRKVGMIAYPKRRKIHASKLLKNKS